MKPLSEQEIREKIVELVHESFDSGYIRGTWAHQNILGDNSREPSNPEDITEQVLDLILQDRKAWGEYVIGEDPERIKNIEWIQSIESEIARTTTHDKVKELQHRLDVAKSFAHGYDKGVDAVLERQRNQGEKTDANM